MTGLTKRCPDCKGHGYTEGHTLLMGAKDGHVSVTEGVRCEVCKGAGRRVPILESDLEAKGQERLPL